MSGDCEMEEVPKAVLCSERCHLGEGPTYDAATDTAWWFDIVERRLFEARLDTGRITIHSLDVMGSALGRIDAHRQLLVADDGLYIREPAGGRMTLYRPLEADNATTRSNDARVHPSGTFWIGTMGRHAERGLGAIYALHRGELSRLYDHVTIPNAICFSPDGTVGYFADTGKNRLFRVDLDPATGLPRGEPAVLITRRGDLECALGRRLHRCLQPARRAPAQPARPGTAVKLPRLRRAGFFAPAGHVGLAGHGRGRKTRRSRSRPHLCARCRRAWPP
jgi:sugar lactone lactonase